MSVFLNLVGAVITALFGAWALVQPTQFSRSLSLTPYKAAGKTEIRATYGGWILGLSIYTLFFQNELLFNCLGYGWLGAGAVRTLAMFFLDKSFSKKQLIFVFIEFFVGILLLL